MWMWYLPEEERLDQVVSAQLDFFGQSEQPFLHQKTRWSSGRVVLDVEIVRKLIWLKFAFEAVLYDLEQCKEGGNLSA